MTERPAGFWVRLGAFFVDLAVVYAVGRAGHAKTSLALLFAAYATVLEASPWHATLGKALVGLKVVDADGRGISPFRSLGRNAALVLSCLTGVGVFVVGFTARKQGLHDWIARTFVVHRRRRETDALPGHAAPLPSAASIEPDPSPFFFFGLVALVIALTAAGWAVWRAGRAASRLMVSAIEAVSLERTADPTIARQWHDETVDLAPPSGYAVLAAARGRLGGRTILFALVGPIGRAGTPLATDWTSAFGSLGRDTGFVVVHADPAALSDEEWRRALASLAGAASPAPQTVRLATTRGEVTAIRFRSPEKNGKAYLVRLNPTTFVAALGAEDHFDEDAFIAYISKR